MTNRGNENLFDVKYKVLLLGDTLVGKTSLQRFIAGKDFRTDIGATIGIYNQIDFFFVERSYDIFFAGVDFVNKIIPVEQSKINLQIW
jgi:GTPase SAR1 family protein